MEDLKTTIESALQHCRWCYEERPYDMYETDASLYLSEAISELGYALEKIDNLISEEEIDPSYIDSESRSKWINVEKKKPVNGYLCLLLTENNFFCIGRRDKKKYITSYGREVNGVTHWAYLPRKSTAKK